LRLDKYLKVTRVIKRRTVANDISSNGRVSINGKVAKPSTPVSTGDIIEIKFGFGSSKIKVISISEVLVENARKERDEKEALLEKSDSLEYIEKIAREELGMIKPGETVFID